MADNRGAVIAWCTSVSATAGTLAGLFASGNTPWQHVAAPILAGIALGALAILIAAGLAGFASWLRARRASKRAARPTAARPDPAAAAAPAATPAPVARQQASVPAPAGPRTIPSRPPAPAGAPDPPAQQAAATRKPFPVRTASAVVATCILLAACVVVLELEPRPRPPSHPEAALRDPGRTIQVNAVAFSPDGKILATGDDNGSTYRWSLVTRKATANLRGRGTSGITGVAFNPRGKILASASKNGKIYLWNEAAGTITATLHDPDSFPDAIDRYAVAFSPDGNSIAASDRERDAAYLSNPATGKTTILHNAGGDAVAFSPNGKILATNDAAIGTAHDTASRTYLWNPGTHKIIFTLRDPAGKGDDLGVGALAFSPADKTLAVGDSDATYLWDLAAHKIIAAFHDQGQDSVTATAFSPDGKTLAVGTYSGTFLWNLASRKIITIFHDQDKRDDPGVTALAFSPDGKTLAVSEGNGSTYLWNMNWLS